MRHVRTHLLLIRIIRGVFKFSTAGNQPVFTVCYNTDNITLTAHLCQTMSLKYRYKFRCSCNALFSCFRLILSIQTNVLKLYRETPTECLAISTPCSPSIEQCHLMLRRDKKFSCLRRIRRQRNQLYPFLQINLQCLTYYMYSSQTRFNKYALQIRAFHKCKFYSVVHDNKR